jgi:hypothetical protein
VPSIEAPSPPPIPTTTPEPLPEAGAPPLAPETPTPQAEPQPAASASPTADRHGTIGDAAMAHWPWIAGGLAALLLLAALKRRRRSLHVEVFEPEAEAAPAQAASGSKSDGEPRPQPRVPAQPALAMPHPEIGRAPAPVELALEAQRMSATLLNTTLSYTLTVTNVGEQALGPVAVMCDLSSAHSSLPAKLQLEVGRQVTEPNHRLRMLEPGETAILKGEMQLPLTEVLTIQAGRKAFFVPLARFRVEAWRSGRPPLVFRRAFVIGQIPDNPAAALKPFRLDLGPRLYSRVSQRELAVAA